MNTVTDLASLPQPVITDELELTSILLAQHLSAGEHKGIKWDLCQASFTFEFTAVKDGEIVARERISIKEMLNAWANQVIDRHSPAEEEVA
jgi:hypothetical protein